MGSMEMPGEGPGLKVSGAKTLEDTTEISESSSGDLGQNVHLKQVPPFWPARPWKQGLVTGWEGGNMPGPDWAHA